MLSDAGARESEGIALTRVMRYVRVASEGGKKSVTQKGVMEATKATQSGGRTVMSMAYFGQGGAPLPQAFFGKPSLTCGPGAQCGGATKKGVFSESALKGACAAEGIKITPYGVKAAMKVASDYVSKTLIPLLKHDHPSAKKWSAAQVRKSAA